MDTPASPVAARFWKKVDLNGPTEPHMPTQCWIWVATLNSAGYGHFGIGQKVCRANRVAWWPQTGKWPTQHLLHACDNRACVRFSHLREGTHAENMRDAAERRRFPHGDAWKVAHTGTLLLGEKHQNSKLKSHTVLAIRHLRKNTTLSQQAIAGLFGICQQTVNHIEHGKTWRHI